MKTLLKNALESLLLVLVLMACKEKEPLNLEVDRCFAWCIVPFDSKNRTPAERMEMLKGLGLSSYAYDWREKHLSEMAAELILAKENNIEVNAIWMWIDVSDSVGALSENNMRILEIIDSTKTNTQLWVGISESWFEGLSHHESLDKASSMIGFLSERASGLGCKVGLYNHGGWYGDPVSQVAIINALPEKDIGIIFNFHHAHEHLKDYPALVDIMMPHLWAVNLNGMHEEGPKILPIGKGDNEQTMVRILEQKGYEGPYGILGHVEEADVAIILKRNLDGYRAL